MKIDELNEAGVPHLPAPKGPHLPTAYKPGAVSTNVASPKPTPGVADIPYVERVPPAQAKPGSSLVRPAIAGATAGGIVAGGIAGMNSASQPRQQNPQTSAATTTTRPQAYSGQGAVDTSDIARKPAGAAMPGQSTSNFAAVDPRRLDKPTTSAATSTKPTMPGQSTSNFAAVDPRRLDKPTMPGQSTSSFAAVDPRRLDKPTTSAATTTPSGSGDSSFGAAFKKAREEHGGPGGKFTWNGKEYQTNIKGEPYSKNPVAVGTKPPEATTTAPTGGGTPMNSADLARAQGKPPAEPATTTNAMSNIQPVGQSKPPANTGLGGSVATDTSRQGQSTISGDNRGGQVNTQAATTSTANTSNTSTVRPAVTTPVSGGNLVDREGKPVTSASDRELAWRQMNPRQPYPGDKEADAAIARRQQGAEQNKQTMQNVGNAISNFFTGNKSKASGGTQTSNPNASNYDADKAEFERDKASMQGSTPTNNMPAKSGSAATDAFESKLRESTMELNNIKKFAGLQYDVVNEAETKETPKGREHKGDYGNKYGKEDVRDQYGHKVGRTNKGAEDKKEAPKRGRGRPTKGDTDQHGHSTKFDTSGLQGMLGGKPKGEVGKKSVKHSLKDWIESVSANMINESHVEEDPIKNREHHSKHNQQGLEEVAPPGAKAERMVKHIKKSYSKDGKLTPKEKSIAYATAWKAHNKGKVEESRDHAASEYTDERVGKILAREKPGLNANSDEFYSAVYHELIQMGLTPKAARYKLNIDEDFMGDVATAYAHYQEHPGLDEEAGAGRGAINPPVADPKAAIPPARTASPGWGKDDYKPLVPDTSVRPFKTAVTDPEGVKEAGSFIRNLASSRNAFEGKDMKDIQLEGWEKELSSLLNENVTISTTIDDQGHDSVNVSATESDAHEIIDLLRNAGIGGMGMKKDHSPEVNNYGLPMSGDEHHGPEAQLIAVDDPHAHDSMGGEEGGDDMLALIKKMTGIEGGEEGHEEQSGQDYESEEVHEEHDDHEHDDSEDEEVDEARKGGKGGKGLLDLDNLNHKQRAFVNAGAGLAAVHGIQSAVGQAADMAGYGSKKNNSAPASTPAPTTSDAGAGQSSSEFSNADPRRLDTGGGDDVDEGNAFTGKLKQTPQGGSFKMGDKEYKDTSSIEEETTDEGNMFTGNLAKARAEHKKEADLDGDGDMEKVREGEDTCNECGMYESECGCDHVDESFANSDDDQAMQDLQYMTRTLSGGGGMGEKRSQATMPIVKIVTAESKLMQDSTDLLTDYKKLSGI